MSDSANCQDLWVEVVSPHRVGGAFDGLTVDKRIPGFVGMPVTL
jgi:hypothetical protein